LHERFALITPPQADCFFSLSSGKGESKGKKSAKSCESCQAHKFLFHSIGDFNRHIPSNAILFTILAAIVVAPIPLDNEFGLQ